MEIFQFMDTSYGSRTGLCVANLFAPLGARVQRPCARRTKWPRPLDVQHDIDNSRASHRKSWQTYSFYTLLWGWTRTSSLQQTMNTKKKKKNCEYPIHRPKTHRRLSWTGFGALPQNHLIFEKETKKQFTITIKKCMAKHENTTYIVVDIRYRYLLYDKE